MIFPGTSTYSISQILSRAWYQCQTPQTTGVSLEDSPSVFEMEE